MKKVIEATNITSREEKANRFASAIKKQSINYEEKLEKAEKEMHFVRYFDLASNPDDETSDFSTSILIGHDNEGNLYIKD